MKMVGIGSYLIFIIFLVFYDDYKSAQCSKQIIEGCVLPILKKRPDMCK